MDFQLRYGKMIHKKDDFEVWSDASGNPNSTQCYWQLANSDRCYGPFPHIAAAVTHYNAWDAARKSTSEVIFVNFKTKQRIQ